jgi:tetratricopeptide (TPR) repeat protein
MLKYNSRRKTCVNRDLNLRYPALETMDANRALEPGMLPENPTLSVCMIVRDEDEVLRRCLESVGSVADELVVLDTGSTDNTVNVAKDFGAKVFHFEWCDDFALARNESLRFATGDWILQVDADEALRSDAIPHLKGAMQKSDVLFYAVRIDSGPEFEPRVAWADRLFRRHPSIFYTRPYHETIELSANNLIRAEPRWEKQNVPDIVIRHYGYNPSNLRENLQGRIPILESYLKEDPTDGYMLGKLGMAYMGLGRFFEAMEYLKKALEITPECPLTNFTLAKILVGQDQLDEAIQCLKKGISGDPFFAEAYAYLGDLFVQKGMMREGISQLKIALEINPDLAQSRRRLEQVEAMSEEHISTLHNRVAVGTGAAGDYNDLGLAYIDRGMYNEAIEAIKKAIALAPDLPNAHLNLGIAYLKKGMLEDGLYEFKRALDIQPDYGKGHCSLGILYLKKGDYKKAAEHCNKAVELGTEVPPQILATIKRHS